MVSENSYTKVRCPVHKAYLIFHLNNFSTFLQNTLNKVNVGNRIEEEF
jgi:hypothetical protein